jgi:hypothetical protein
MGVNAATSIVNDGLFFGYDTGHDVANPSNITRFFPGEPTTNLITANLETVGTDGSGQSSVGTRTTIAPNHVRIVDSASNTRQSYLIQSLTGSATYTVSIQFRKISGTPTFRFQIQNYSGGSYLSTIKFTNTAETGLLDIDGWQTAKWTFTLASNANGVRLWLQDGADYTTYDHSFELRNPQLELKSHASNYVSGTRSDTAGLIDLKRTKAIDLGSVGFTSGQELDFDGSDDKIELGNHLNTIGSEATFDMVFKSYSTNDSFKVMIGWGHGTSNYSHISIGNLTSGYNDESLHVVLNASFEMYVREGHTTYKDNEYHHLSVTLGANNYSVWIDGVEKTFTFAQGSQASHFPEIVGYNSNITTRVGQRIYTSSVGAFEGEIPVMKVYNRVLTDEEILRNYKAYKNRFGI